MKVRFKKLHPDAMLPAYSKEGDAGLDMVAVSAVMHKSGDYIEYGTGLAAEIPEGYVGLLFPRSSVTNRRMILLNCVGVIDSGYRGEIKFRFKDFDMTKFHNDQETFFGGEYCYEVGDRIGQLIIMPYPHIEVEEAAELTDTERGQGGYGSTGN